MKKTLWLMLLAFTWINAEVVTLTDSSYKDKIKEHKKVILMFSAPWCGACQSMKPLYGELAIKNKGSIFFTEINTDENQEITRSYGIDSLPTMVMLEDGKETKRVSGSLEEDEFELFMHTDRIVKEYNLKCEKGDGKACLFIGELYEEGELVKKDYAKALSFYKKSCDAKYAEGCMYLGYMYDEGMGVKQDYSTAIKHYALACDGNNTIACRFLGYLYDEGLGAKRDYLKAHELYIKACTKKDEYACNNLGFMYSKGNGVEKNLKKALEYYLLSCRYGHDAACEEVEKFKE